MATPKSGSAAKGSAGKSSAKKSGGGAKSAQQSGISEVLQGVTVDESMVEEWRARLRELGGKVDLKKSLDAAKKLANSSAANIKKAGGKNPTLFYSGLAALVVGAGMMTAAHKVTARKSGASKKKAK